MTFHDQEFNKVLKESDSPELIDWELLVESHGVKIYRLYRSQSKLYEYKVAGTINIKADLCAAVYMDIAYRKSWDGYVKELAYIRKSDPEVIYWEVAYPWPMSNRDPSVENHGTTLVLKGRRFDTIQEHVVVSLAKYLDIPEGSATIRFVQYVYLRQMKEMKSGDRRVWVVLGRSAKSSELSERETVDAKKGVIRVDDYLQSLVIQDTGNNTSRIFMHYYDDPKGMIPTMIMNWAAKTGVPGFLTNLEDACRKYPKSLPL